MSKLREIAENIANEIADQFVPGFFDDRMVQLHADLIEKHIVATVEKTVAECIDEINSLAIVNHGGRPMEEVVHHLMILKYNIRDRFKIN
jgi:hypothetical protein